MPLNYQERRIYHWHEELDRRLAKAGVQIRDDLRVEPMLADWIEN
jgi:predicted RecB family nuclease